MVWDSPLCFLVDLPERWPRPADSDRLSTADRPLSKCRREYRSYECLSSAIITLVCILVTNSEFDLKKIYQEMAYQW